MTISLLKRLAAFLLLATLSCLVAGCWNPFAPPKGDQTNQTSEDYRERTSPRNVLHNIRVAYEYENADRYLDCLSEDYIFYSAEEDVNDPEDPIDPYWYKSDERDMHEHMFADDSNVDRIQLTLTTSDTTYLEGNPETPSDDIWIFTENVDLWLYQTGGLQLNATTPSEFRFRIDVDQVGPNGETLYEIYEWYDLGAPTARAASGDPGTERMSLSRLKSMFAD
jgi:hypothetical protein